MYTKREKLETILDAFAEVEGIIRLELSSEKFHSGTEYFVFGVKDARKRKLENVFIAFGFNVDRRYQSGVNITVAKTVDCM